VSPVPSSVFEERLMSSNPFEQPGRFYKGNLHTHSDTSDGQLPAAEVCRRYRERGYDFLCLSDHFLPKYDFPVTDTRPFRTDDFTTILGAEMHVGHTALGEKWHLLANGLPLDFAAPHEGETAPEIAARCRAAGAFVSIVHPAWYALRAASRPRMPSRSTTTPRRSRPTEATARCCSTRCSRSGIA
jgi:histidinol phosphatase-like PHP family hydrolase